MLRALGSADALLDVCLAAYVLRMLCYSGLPYLRSAWWVLPIETLHGLTFACGWGAGTEKSKALAPPGLEATQQAIFQGEPSCSALPAIVEEGLRAHAHWSMP